MEYGLELLNLVSSAENAAVLMEARLTVGLDDLKSLFQPKQPCGSMI